MTISRLEINIKRLLKSTETLNRDDSTSLNWKLEKVGRINVYIELVDFFTFNCN